MGVYSTLFITQSKAEEVLEALLERELDRLRRGRMSQAEMEAKLDAYLEPSLRNSRVVPNDHERNDDQWVPHPMLD